MNIEQIKLKLADALANRTDPPFLGCRARYHFWVDENTKEVRCSWAPPLRLQKWQHIFHTCMCHPGIGFTAEEWDKIAEKVRPFLAGDNNE